MNALMRRQKNLKKHSKSSRLKNIIRVLLLVVCGTIIGFNVYLANANGLVGNKLPMPFGYGAAVVLSGSMEPELSKGDLIIVKETDSFSMNQVVVYQDGNSLVVHRIIELNDGSVTTKGDANNTLDDPIETSRISGEVVLSFPYVGNIVEFIKTPIGTIIVIALAIILMELPRLKEKQKDIDELEKIKEEIRKLKDEVWNSQKGVPLDEQNTKTKSHIHKRSGSPVSRVDFNIYDFWIICKIR